MQHDEPLLPGETVTLFMNFSDDEMKEPVTIRLQKTDLKGPLNEKITAGNVSIKPSAVTIKPGENKEVAIHVKIPSHCKKGHYTALFTDVQNPLLKALINIEVV